MKKAILFILPVFLSAVAVKAQKGNNQLGIAGELGFPIGHFDNDFNTGYGGSVKGMFGIGKSAQLTFTTGYTNFKSKGENYHSYANAAIIPFLAGYRLLKNGFYAEPQLGFGLYHIKVDAFGIHATETDGAFTYAFGVGYTRHGIDIGVRYQGGKKDSDDISIIGVHAGYNISFRK